jgi:hypothetical protein
MINQFPDATKMVLSPAAQAVLDAFGKHPLHSDHISDGLLYGALPAALRAAADQVTPLSTNLKQNNIRYELLAIANELEGNF